MSNSRSILGVSILVLLALGACNNRKQKKLPAAAASASVAHASPAGKSAAPADLTTPPADAVKEKSGLVSKVLTRGSGKEPPGRRDGVRVHYTVWDQSNGRLFEDTTSGDPHVLPAGRFLLQGWTEILDLMVQGERRRFWVPAELAYRKGSPLTGPVTLDLELVEVLRIPETPKDVAKAPPTATKTASGLAYQVLQEPKGKKKPGADSRVQLNYSIWSPQGELLDTSLTGGAPRRFDVGKGEMVRGLVEGLKLMAEGEKRRFWVPGKLAHGELENGKQPGGAVRGALVYEVELVVVD